MADNIFICGGGHQGLSMAGHLSLCGEKVNLWNRTAENIATVLETKQIECDGIVKGIAEIEKVSINMGDVFSDFVMITTPSTAHEDIARQMAKYVSKETIIILNPGRTFGAIEFAETLKSCGVKELPYIAETQTIVYTCRRTGGNRASIIALKRNVRIASLQKNDIDYIIAHIPQCIRNCFVKEESVAMTSFSNVGMVLHCAPVLMNIGWIETDRTAFKYYYEGISQSVAGFIEKIDAERVQVAKALGFRVKSTKEWMEESYGIVADSLYDAIRKNEAYREIDAPSSLKCRYIEEDIPNGLVPLEALGIEVGVDVSNMTLIINLANAVMKTDYRAIGHRISSEKLIDYLEAEY